MEYYFREQDRTIEVAELYQEDADVILYKGDCTELLETIPTDSVDLIITSPPYNLGKEYEKSVALNDYLKMLKPILEKLNAVLSPSGSICWQVGNYVDRGEVFPLDIYFYDEFKHLGLKLRNRIIWRFGHGLHASKRFSGRYEVILWFTKTDEYVFNLDPVRIPSKYPGKLHYKGPNKGRPSGNPLGKNPSDIWDVVGHDWESEVWDIPNVKANHPEKTVHPSQFPVELVERCILALTHDGGVVLDPFAGVGSTVVAAIQHGRKSIAAEREENYVTIAGDRIRRLTEGELRLRPIGKPIHEPTGKEKVSQMPLEWDSQDRDRT